MPRLNDQFMETLTHTDGSLKVVPDGYSIAEHEQGGTKTDIWLYPYGEPGITAHGALEAGVLKGGIEYDEETGRFTDGGLGQKGLLMEVDEPDSMRRYLIPDTDEEEVLVCFWDPNAIGNDPVDGEVLGRYGDYSPVPPDEGARVKEVVQCVINAGKVAVDSQLAA